MLGAITIEALSWLLLLLEVVPLEASSLDEHGSHLLHYKSKCLIINLKVTIFLIGFFFFKDWCFALGGCGLECHGLLLLLLFHLLIILIKFVICQDFTKQIIWLFIFKPISL